MKMLYECVYTLAHIFILYAKIYKIFRTTALPY